MDGMGTAHYVRRSGDLLDRHDGPVEKCRDPGCEWPRIGGMVTITSGGRQVTGSLALKEGGAVEVDTADGKKHRGPKVTARRPEWGTYCPHGTKLVEAVPAEHTCEESPPPCALARDLGHLCVDHRGWCKACYPDGRKILPWPCPEDGCTEADFDREQCEAEEAYHEEMRREAYGF